MTRYITLFTAVSRSFVSDVIRRSIMTSRKARRFRAIFAQNFLKIHIFSWNIDIFRNYHVIKRIWNEFSFHTVFMKLVMCFISPRQRLRDIKHTTRFINTVWNENSFQILYLKLIKCLENITHWQWVVWIAGLFGVQPSEFHGGDREYGHDSQTLGRTDWPGSRLVKCEYWVGVLWSWWE